MLKNLYKNQIIIDKQNNGLVMKKKYSFLGTIKIFLDTKYYIHRLFGEHLYNTCLSI